MNSALGIHGLGMETDINTTNCLRPPVDQPEGIKEQTNQKSQNQVTGPVRQGFLFLSYMVAQRTKELMPSEQNGQGGRSGWSWRDPMKGVLVE